MPVAQPYYNDTSGLKFSAPLVWKPKMGDSGQSWLRLRLQTNILTRIPTPTPVAKKLMTLTPAPTPVAKKLMTPTPAPLTLTRTPVPTPVEYIKFQSMQYFQ